MPRSGPTPSSSWKVSCSVLSTHVYIYSSEISLESSESVGVVEILEGVN